MNAITDLTAVELTSKLVQIDSTNPGAYESKIGKFIYEYIQEAGIKPEISSPTEDDRFNVRGIISGDAGRPALVFICHMDTVQIGSGWSDNPFSGEIEDGKLWGRGACDMKAGLACALTVFAQTAKFVKSGELQLLHPLVFIGTYDEEGNMEGVEKAIADGWVTSEDWIVDLEPTDGQIQMAHKGRTWFEVEVQGVTAHASMPEKGVDAIAGMAAVITYINEEMKNCPIHEELGRSTVTFGQIQGGYSPYVVPDKCRVTIDMRLAPPMHTKEAKRVIEDAIREAGKHVQGIKGSWKITGDRPCIETNRDSLLLNQLQNAVEIVTNEEADIETFPGYTDTAVIAGTLGNRECMSYGPGSLKWAHKPDEFVNTTDIERCQEVFRVLVKNLLTERRAL